MKPKVNRAGSEQESKPFDRCQSPPATAKTLQGFISQNKVIWESAVGEKYLMRGIAQYLQPKAVIGTDILGGVNFFETSPDNWDIQITNPPYSMKFPWLKRSYELGKPFALLLPVETIGAKKAQSLFQQYGVEIILISPRINFVMPEKGLNGKGAQFPVCWITNSLNIGQQISYATYVPDKELVLKKAA